MEADVGEDVEQGRATLGITSGAGSICGRLSEGWRGCAWGVPRAGPSRACLSGSLAASSATTRVFLRPKRAGERKTSARRPAVKAAVHSPGGVSHGKRRGWTHTTGR